MMKARRT